MKAERLLAAFGQLEEQYIEEAAPGALGKMRASSKTKRSGSGCDASDLCRRLWNGNGSQRRFSSDGAVFFPHRAGGIGAGS